MLPQPIFPNFIVCFHGLFSKVSIYILQKIPNMKNSRFFHEVFGHFCYHEKKISAKLFFNVKRGTELLLDQLVEMSHF